jgi:hypothetical protein
VTVFSATSVNGKCVGNNPSSAALKKRLGLRRNSEDRE